MAVSSPTTAQNLDLFARRTSAPNGASYLKSDWMKTSTRYATTVEANRSYDWVEGLDDHVYGIWSITSLSMRPADLWWTWRCITFFDSDTSGRSRSLSDEAFGCQLSIQSKLSETVDRCINDGVSGVPAALWLIWDCRTFIIPAKGRELKSKSPCASHFHSIFVISLLSSGPNRGKKKNLTKAASLDCQCLPLRWKRSKW